MIPIHNLKCELCGITWEQACNPLAPPLCECGGQTKITYNWGTVKIDVFKPYIDEHISQTPVRIESKQHLARVCERNNVKSHRLENSYKTYSRQREF
jgi:hypothetical protein